MLAVFGVLLWWVDAQSRTDRGLDSIGPRTGLCLGPAAGAGPAAGRVAFGDHHDRRSRIGMDRESAARFSFLLAMPDHRGRGAVQGRRPVHDGFQGYGTQFLWGFVASAISGFVVIWVLLSYLRRTRSRCSCGTGWRWRD